MTWRPPLAARMALVVSLWAFAIGAAPLPTLRWTGTARIFVGERTIDIGVSTRVVPFASARSDTWLASDGPSKTRSLVIEGDQGWIERDSARQPMPAAMLAHERLQYGLYGLMLSTHAKDRCVHAAHDGAPPTILCFARDGRLESGSNVVPDPDGGPPIPQSFAFDGDIVSNGTHWPRTIRISQRGKPYFELNLTSFEAEPDRH